MTRSQVRVLPGALGRYVTLMAFEAMDRQLMPWRFLATTVKVCVSVTNAMSERCGGRV